MEHVFGILKGRFSSLQGLRVAHKGREDQARASIWIRCCVLLHNLIRSTGIEADDPQWELDVPEDDDKRRRRPGEPSAIITRARDHPQRLKVMRDMGLKTPPRTSTQRPT